MSKTYKPLDELLVSSGLRYDAIASKMGVSYDALYRIRLNPGRMSLERVRLIGEITGVGDEAILDIMKEYDYTA